MGGGMWKIGDETREIFMYYMRIRVIFRRCGREDRDNPQPHPIGKDGDDRRLCTGVLFVP